MGEEDNTLTLLGINLTTKPRWLQLLICAGGFFFGYTINGICEGFVYLGLILWQGFILKHILNPWKTYVKLSAVLMGSHGLTKGSLMFLNYPAQIMFKSTKVLPVMVTRAFIPGLRRKYPLQEYVSAVMLVVGLVVFTLADAHSSPNFHIFGVVMVVSALVLDFFLGNLQEAIFKMNPATTQMEILFCSTLVGLPFLIPPMVLTGEVFRAWVACSKVTTARKAFTLLLSYIIFTKPLSKQHVTGLLLIAMGITMRLLPDYSAKINKHKYERIQPGHANDQGNEDRHEGESSSV